MTTAGQLAESPSPDVAGAPSTLLDRARVGDLEAVKQILAEHREGLFAIAWSYLRNREEALDACQEALAKGLASASRFDSSQSMSAWLSKIVRNVCLDRLRRLKFRSHASLDQRQEIGLPDPAGYGSSPEQTLLGNELRERLKVAMRTLRPEEREVLYLRDGLEWPYARIEKFLGLSHGTVASLIHRARARIRDQMSGYLDDDRGRQGRRAP